MQSRPATLPIVALICLLALIVLGAVWWWSPLWDHLMAAFRFISDREQVKTFVYGFGTAAPLVFIGLQVLQVLFAPVPGEASGFIGGYLFGVWRGFLSSSIGLAIGSWINFAIGRVLGEHFVRKLIPRERWQRLDHLVRHQGVIVLFLLFVFPGFPKDYLCLFLGLTHLPMKVFLVLASVGRMPGTYMLSLQGASLFERNYWALSLVMALCLVVALLAYRFRDTIYRWIEKANSHRPKH